MLAFFITLCYKVAEILYKQLYLQLQYGHFQYQYLLPITIGYIMYTVEKQKIVLLVSLVVVNLLKDTFHAANVVLDAQFVFCLG